MSYLSIIDTHSKTAATIWHPIPGHPDHIANLDTGEIKSIKSGRILRQTPQISGGRCYVTCSLGRVHRLLMAASIGRNLTRKEFVCHADGNPLNNNLSNLKLGSAKDNSRDKVRHNTNGTKLRNADVAEIRALSGRKSAKWLAARYGVTVRHIRWILSGGRWANLPC